MAKFGKNEPCFCKSGRKYKRCHGATKANNNIRYKPMPRQEFWRLRYRARRYLEHLSKEDLSKRANDIVHNMTSLRDDLKIGFPSIEEDGAYWGEAFTHLLEECGLRGLPLGDILSNDEKDNPLPNYEIQGLEETVKEVKQLNLQKGKYLVKYGEYKYLEAMLKKGS